MQTDLRNDSVPREVNDVGSARHDASHRAAFFDVDETLITAKGMFDFLRYWLALQGDDGSIYEQRTSELLDIARRGLPREEGNRLYYSNFAGAPVAEVMAVGRDWYADYRSRPTPFVAASVAALVRHKAAGDRVVLVSGSFPPCLTPLAEDVEADLVLCTEALVAADGTFTGEVGTSMIGTAKADAVSDLVSQLGMSAENCFAYGDHSSDLDMLQSVGRPVVVGADPVLVEHAGKHGWPILSAAGGSKSHE